MGKRQKYAMYGLSPRVRGNRGTRRGRGRRRRSIPACAGEPLYTIGIGSATPVYPRVCGEPGPIIRASA